MDQQYEKYVGQIFDNRYRIERVIGIGGMAIVFKAADLLMRRLVAVKILKDEIAADEQAVKRFINESKAVAMLSHPNIVNIYDVSVRDNIKYIVMEYVDGITLKNYMRHREVLNLREIISYTTQILRALDHAHKKGIIHRDIKPQNIMLLKNGAIKVMDFGIAKLPNAETITMTDKAIGTVYYISPEQASGLSIDTRSDLYSLGVMMYEMATGSLPFTADTPVTVALMQVNDAPLSPRQINPQIPVGLEQIILRAMEKDPDMRYQSAEEMLSHLMKLRDNPRVVFRENAKAAKKAGSGQKKRRRGSRSMFPIIMGVTVAFLLVASVSAYYLVDRLFLNSPANQYQTIAVDQFVGSTYTEELEKWFRESVKYMLADVSYAYDDSVPEGKILSQTPNAGEARKILPEKQKCSISLVISKGPETLVLQDYTVMDYREAETALRKLGLKVEIKEASSSTFEMGAVLQTDPAAGAVMKLDDTVILYVNHGADTERVMVPNFIGLTEAEALIKLEENDLTKGKVTYKRSDSVPGTIIQQSVDAWKEVSKYSAIDFEVSGGAYYSGNGTSVPTASDLYPPETRQEETQPPETQPEETEPEETESTGSDMELPNEFRDEIDTDSGGSDDNHKYPFR